MFLHFYSFDARSTQQTKDVGWVNGDGTRHGAAMCDHRAQRGVRITATVFLVDLTRENRGGLYDVSHGFVCQEYSLIMCSVSYVLTFLFF